jgi:hypothetical protein
MMFAALHESGCGTNRTNRVGPTKCPFLGVDRKWLADGQNGAFDPTETSGMTSFEHYFLLAIGSQSARL